MDRHLYSDATLPLIGIELIDHHEPRIVKLHQLGFHLRIVNSGDINEKGIGEFSIRFQILQNGVSLLFTNNNDGSAAHFVLCQESICVMFL